jgi:hypothetical protein
MVPYHIARAFSLSPTNTGHPGHLWEIERMHEQYGKEPLFETLGHTKQLGPIVRITVQAMINSREHGSRLTC